MDRGENEKAGRPSRRTEYHRDYYWRNVEKRRETSRQQAKLRRIRARVEKVYLKGGRGVPLQKLWR